LASAFSLQNPERVMARWMVRTVGFLVYAAVAERIRRALQEHGATFPDHKGHRLQHPTARWVFHAFVGMPGLSIPGHGLVVLRLPDEHQHLLQLLGKPYDWFYR
jgi:hypothetical protein